MKLQLCGKDGILSSPMAQLWLNCLKMKLLGNIYHQNDVADIGYFGLRELKLAKSQGHKIKGQGHI